jgi:hypothetical protein
MRGGHESECGPGSRPPGTDPHIWGYELRNRAKHDVSRKTFWPLAVVVGLLLAALLVYTLFMVDDSSGGEPEGGPATDPRVTVRTG